VLQIDKTSLEERLVKDQALSLKAARIATDAWE